VSAQSFFITAFQLFPAFREELSKEIGKHPPLHKYALLLKKCNIKKTLLGSYTLSIALYTLLSGNYSYSFLIDTIFYFKHICKKLMHKIFGHRMKYNSSTTCSYRSALVNTKHGKKEKSIVITAILVFI